MSSPRLFLDVGLVAVEPTGIPRATRNLALALKEFAPSLGIEALWCVADRNGRYVEVAALPPPRFLPPSVADDSVVERVLDVARRLPIPLSWRNAASRALGRAPRLATFWQLAQAPPISPERGGRDVLLLPHAGYSRLPRQAIARFAEAGGRIAAICYDILPLSRKDAFAAHDVTAFRNAFTFTLSRAEMLIVSSEPTRRDVAAWCRAHARTPPAMTVVWPIIALPPPQRAPRDEILAMERRPTILMVGTFVARKNHLILLEAATALWDEGLDFDLLLIGQATPFGRGILRTIRTHAEFGRRLRILHDASDADVADAYRRARVVAMPSEAEGFGLPVAEAETAGCPVVCSDLEVFREFASADVTFVPPRDVAAWRTALAACLSAGTGRREKAAKTEMSWNREQACRLRQALFPSVVPPV